MKLTSITLIAAALGAGSAIAAPQPIDRGSVNKHGWHPQHPHPHDQQPLPPPYDQHAHHPPQHPPLDPTPYDQHAHHPPQHAPHNQHPLDHDQHAQHLPPLPAHYQQHQQPHQQQPEYIRTAAILEEAISANHLAKVDAEYVRSHLVGLRPYEHVSEHLANRATHHEKEANTLSEKREQVLGRRQRINHRTTQAQAGRSQSTAKQTSDTAWDILGVAKPGITRDPIWGRYPPGWPHVV